MRSSQQHKAASRTPSSELFFVKVLQRCDVYRPFSRPLRSHTLFCAAVQVSKWRMMSRGLVETLEVRGTWAAERRLELRICPSDVEGLEVLRPKVREISYPSMGFSGRYILPFRFALPPRSTRLSLRWCTEEREAPSPPPPEISALPGSMRR